MNPLPYRRLFCVIGAPGSGKTTIARLVSRDQRDRIGHYSVGELLRREIARDSEAGRRARACVERGKLAPLDVVMQILGDAIASDRRPCLLIDGFPRSLEQALALDEWLASQSSLTLAAVIEVVVSEATARERALSRARGSDDRPEVFRERMQAYLEFLSALEDYYETRGILVRIDGEQAVDEVVAAMQAVLMAGD